MTLEMTDRDFPDLGDVAPAGAEMGPVTGSPFVAVPFLASAIRRRWRVWAATLLLGVLLGLLLTLAFPSQRTATATLLLVHPGGSLPTHAMQTNLGLLETTTVAQAAIDRLGLAMSPQRLRKQYYGTLRSEDLFSVSARGPDTREASRRAAAVAEAFLAFRAEEFGRQSEATVRALDERQRALTAELAVVSAQIGATPPDQKTDAAVRAFGELLNTRASLNEQIAGLRQRIDDATTEGRAVLDHSRVIDPPAADDESRLRIVAGNLGAGAVAGLTLGLGWVVLQAVTSNRARNRDEIAALLSASVALTVGRLRGGGRAQRRRLRRHLERPNAEAVAMVRHLWKACLRSRSVKPGLVVGSLGPQWPAAFAVAATAMELRDEGMNVLVVDFGRAPASREVFDVPPEPISSYRSTRSGSTLTLVFPNIGRRPPDRELQSLREEADVVLALASLDNGHGADELSEWVKTAVVMVTTGSSAPTAIRSGAAMLRAAGINVDSAILVRADKGDDSSGIFTGYEYLLGGSR